MPCAATIRSSPPGAVWLAAALLLLAAAPSLADDRAPSTRGWFEVDFGAGQLHRSMPGFSDSVPRFFMQVSGGVAFPRLLMLGVEVGGWEIRTTSPADPSRGATVHPLFLTARIYPLSGLPFNVRLGAGFIIAEGYAQYTSADFTGIGWEAGVGYDLRLRGHHHLTPFVLYCSGHVGTMGANLNILTIGAGYTYR